MPTLCHTAIYIYISGAVQGVHYRSEYKKNARQRGQISWVKNLSDEQVEIYAYGTPSDLTQLEARCKIDNPLIQVNPICNTAAQIEPETQDFQIHL